jgi:hypothetical protein
LAQRIGPDVVPAVLDAGLNLDFVDDGVLAERARVDQGQLAIGENRYRAIIIPDVERMPVRTLLALESFAKQGVVVVATRRTPALAPGYLASRADHDEIGAISDRLFRGASPAGLFVERDAGLGAALRSRLEPDMAVSAGAADIGFVHRRTDAGDLYFVANTSNVRQSVDATFRVTARRAQQWNPLTGQIAPIALRRPAGQSGGTVALDLAPYESTVIVFPAAGAGSTTEPVAGRGTLPPPLDISTGWSVTFGPAGAPAEWPMLRSWTDDEATQYFSGTARYEKTVEVPAAMPGRGRSLHLDLGAPKAIAVGGPRARVQAWIDAPVRDAPVVLVHSQRAGSVWCPPYTVDVTPFVRPGRNLIRIDVANLAVNEMAGRALPDYRLLNLRYGTRFEPQDMDKVRPLPAGLFGPIRLVAAPAARTEASARQ